MNELNQKLAEWVGFKEQFSSDSGAVGWQYPDDPYPPEGEFYVKGLPDFTKSLDACFKWLVPKLQETGTGYSIEFIHNKTEDYSKRFECVLLHEYYGINSYFGGANKINTYSDKFDPALALCLAISKLIEQEVDNT